MCFAARGKDAKLEHTGLAVKRITQLPHRQTIAGVFTPIGPNAYDHDPMGSWGRRMATSIDDALKLEAVYFSAPIPHNLAVLTVLGAVFDKVYFPGVWMPKAGYDQKELETEIARLEALPPAPSTYDRGLLIGVLKLLKYAPPSKDFASLRQPKMTRLAIKIRSLRRW
jgi:hypothetical protein